MIYWTVRFTLVLLKLMTTAWWQFCFDPQPLNISVSLPKHHTTIQRTMLGNFMTTTSLISSSLILVLTEIEIGELLTVAVCTRDSAFNTIETVFSRIVEQIPFKKDSLHCNSLENLKAALIPQMIACPETELSALQLATCHQLVPCALSIQ